MTRVIEPAPGSGAARAGSVRGALTGLGPGGAAQESAPETSVAQALADLVATLERAAEELFASVPFLGDQATGASVNAYVDAVVAAMHELRAEADDLRRVVAICEQGPRGRA